MRNDYRVKQGLPKRVDVAPPPVCWPLPHHSHLTKNLLPSRLSLFSVRSRVVLKLILPTPHAREFNLVSVTQLILLSQTRVFETTNAIRKPTLLVVALTTEPLGRSIVPAYYPCGWFSMVMDTTRLGTGCDCMSTPWWAEGG
jgi:hypothetical protein